MAMMALGATGAVLPRPREDRPDSTRERVRARVVIADPETLFRAGLVRLLAERPDLEVVGEAADGEEALRLLASRRPDVLVIDPTLPLRGGIELIVEIAVAHPSVHVLVLTAASDDAEVIALLRGGAAGYLLKSADADAVACAIHVLQGGKSVMSDAIAARLVGLLTGEPARRDDYDGLTAREIEVLRLVAAGTAYKQVARMLRISHQTVRTHVCHIYDKLAVYDRSQVIRYALRKGLIEL